jgi:modulator of FtsH protease HflC
VNRALSTLLVAAGALLLALAACFYQVREWERVLLFRLGEIRLADVPPGLHFKVPLLNRVVKYDGRIQTLDRGPVRYQTSELKNVVVDAFVKWRIDDPVAYYVAVGAGNVNERLAQIINDLSRNEFGKRTVQDAVTGDRRAITEALRTRAQERAAAFGVAIVDVRIKRVDLPLEVSASVYRRMEAERKRVAADLRARGEEAGERIRADADRERTVLIAQAEQEAQTTRGRGDAQATAIYAQAYGRDAEFFRFYRSLEAYRRALGSGQDVLVLDPDSDFFRFFASPDGER